MQKREWLLDRFSVMYTAVAIPLIAYTSILHGLVFKERYEFIPLMLTSAYCALGVVGSWVGFLVVYFEL
jgi:alpha-1,3-glucosyltransferase